MHHHFSDFFLQSPLQLSRPPRKDNTHSFKNPRIAEQQLGHAPLCLVALVVHQVDLPHPLLQARSRNIRNREFITELGRVHPDVLTWFQEQRQNFNAWSLLEYPSHRLDAASMKVSCQLKLPEVWKRGEYR